MSIKLFITGTDTEVGKTYFSTALLRKFNALNLTTLGIKPIASGCKEVAGKLYNDDALALMQDSSIKLPYDRVNPYAFEKPIAPSIAARERDVCLDKERIIEQINNIFNIPSDVHLIEGLGGWQVPINDHILMSDIVISLQIPTILVVAIKLGCINHAILTNTIINQSKTPYIGWVANCIDRNTREIPQIITELKKWIKAPCLAILPYRQAADQFIDADLIKECF
jgi:dethiobiotin synthetase